MTSADSGVDTALLGYLLALPALGGTVIALLYALYSVDMPGYARGMVQAPVRTAQGDLLSTVLLVSVLLGVVLLISLIVVFGAKYGLTGEDAGEYTGNP